MRYDILLYKIKNWSLDKKTIEMFIKYYDNYLR